MPFTATVAHLSTLTGTDAARLADDFDAEPVTRLTEDENPHFTDAEFASEAGWLFDLDADEDFFWGLSVHNNG